MTTFFQTHFFYYIIFKIILTLNFVAYGLFFPGDRIVCSVGLDLRRPVVSIVVLDAYKMRLISSYNMHELSIERRGLTDISLESKVV